jgi:LysM repeat protein
MKTRRLFRYASTFVLILVLAVLLGACTRSASEGPTAVDGTSTSFPVPQPTEQNMGGIDTSAIQTQTAQAQVPAEVQPTATSQPAVTATPEPTAVPVQPTAAPIIVSPTPGIPENYTLQAGEFPFCIARRFNVDQYELLSLNGLSLNSRPQVGVTLKIPQTGNPFVGERALKAHPTTYTVLAGDSVYTIACAFGDVSPDMIALLNNLSQPYTVTVGQVLQIP